MAEEDPAPVGAVEEEGGGEAEIALVSWTINRDETGEDAGEVTAAAAVVGEAAEVEEARRLALS